MTGIRPDAGKALQAPGTLRVRLVGSREHGTHAQIIHLQVLGFFHVFPAFHRKTDDRPWPQQPPGHGHGHVLLAQVDAIGPHGQGNVHAVIDQQGHAGGSQALLEPQG
jgi:hypothetical protein